MQNNITIAIETAKAQGDEKMNIDGVEVQGVTSDSRKVKTGYVFVAIKGAESDGNNYIGEAIQRGAVIIYTEHRITALGVMIKICSNARKTLADLCNAFYDHPSEKIRVIGITGTNGKTTTSHIIYHALKESGVSVGLIGTLDIKINNQTHFTELTTPSAEDIYYYLNKMVQQKVQVVVMEVSSHGLKSERVHGIKFDIAIHTNIERDHLNYHKNMGDYIRSKKKLFDCLSPGKVALLNLDDNHSLELLTGNNGLIVVTYGLNVRATVTASSIDTELNTTFHFCLQRGMTTLAGLEVEPFEYPFSINLLGKHNIYNSLAAITCCLLLDLSCEEIAKNIKSFTGVTRRLEVIYKKGYTVIDDFSHNPASYGAVFESMQNLEYKNLHVINAIRGSRGADINQENADVLKIWYELLGMKTLMITSSKDKTGKLDEVQVEEIGAFFKVLSEGSVNFEYVDHLSDAIETIIPRIEEGDLLLLLGAQGMDKGKEIFLKDIGEEYMKLGNEYKSNDCIQIN
ncbi:UDP-N-acetylmuramyl-tripeptide synthetase [Alkaliphilus metalliredigens QYMF]|uniref:UDP-N-acetylmuramyl-tripeptide synthetase n=1 Tax=Alkaliphilus metalliredigens (strain QYMF) TaxID=293826 RepID=A6TNM7_ALKMQ|nr:UDP-N-acetylmuramyl-tripeptide synthetase [Alkaliphilus metalliredigens]ABR47795.1 UDP-N-acetylmuramyl-tripeptide synthetase [Alkaliphilus metalliredigens QYMF]